MATFILQAQQQQHQRHNPVLVSFIITTLISLLSTPSVVCRSVPTSPLSDERAEELVHEKINGELVAVAHVAKLAVPAAELSTFFAVPTYKQVKGSAWKLRSLWVSVTGKEPSAILPSSSSSSFRAETRSDELSHAAGKSITSNETLLNESSRQVPGGPDPLHHSNQPSSP